MTREKFTSKDTDALWRAEEADLRVRARGGGDRGGVWHRKCGLGTKQEQEMIAMITKS